jgi:transcriptional regulator with XRE-family HTH domain
MKRTPLAMRRLQAGYTQKELADKAGLSKNAVQRAESCQTDPLMTTIVALAEALECTYQYIISDILAAWEEK